MGGAETRRVDVRLIAGADPAHLSERRANRMIDEDLYARIAPARVVVPTLS